jgi:hypothetical protein
MNKDITLQTDVVNTTLSLPPMFTLSEPKISADLNVANITATITATVEFKITAEIDNYNLLLITQEVTKNLWHIKKYLDMYIAHLQGSTNEEEFDEISMSFIKEKNTLTIDQIKICSIYLKSLLPDIEFDDIANLLNVDFNDIALIMEGKK